MFRNHCSNVIKNMYDNSYYHLTHNQLRRFENVCFLAMPFYKLDISSLLEILVFNFIFRSLQKFLASVLCMFQLCFFQVQTSIFTVVFFCINCSRNLEYEFKRNEKEVLYIEDSILDKRKFGVFKACFTERLANQEKNN